MFNCRKIPEQQKREMNILQGICNNFWFLLIILVEVNIQYAAISFEWLCFVFGTTPITWQMQVTALCCGLGTLVISALVKLTPHNWIKKCEKRNDSDIFSDRMSFLRQTAEQR